MLISDPRLIFTTAEGRGAISDVEEQLGAIHSLRSVLCYAQPRASHHRMKTRLNRGQKKTR